MTAPKLFVAIRAFLLCLAVALTGCSITADDGYLAPPAAVVFDRRAALERAHRELGPATYQELTRDTECREACDVFQRGFEQARRLRIVLPAECSEQFEIGLWSQTEYQEGCRAYALAVLSLVDRYREAERVSS